MAYASRSGRARTNANAPEAFGVCARCGIWYNRDSLQNQMEWRGSTIMPLYIFVCRDCYDVPQTQLRAIVIPADPVPIKFPLVEPYTYDSSDTMSLAPAPIDPIVGIPVRSSTVMTTIDGTVMTRLPTGRPTGLDPRAVQPLQTVNGVVEHFDIVLPILSALATAPNLVTMTCSAPHGLSSGNQISAEGLSQPPANGLFTVNVTTATAFSYAPYPLALVPGSLLTSGVRVATALVGLPRGYPAVPQPGP